MATAEATVEYDAVSSASEGTKIGYVCFHRIFAVRCNRHVTDRTPFGVKANTARIINLYTGHFVVFGVQLDTRSGTGAIIPVPVDGHVAEPETSRTAS